MGLRRVRRSDAALRPGLRPRAQFAPVHGVGRRRRIQRRPRHAQMLGQARRGRHRPSRQRPRLAGGRLHHAGRRGHEPRHLARARRHRPQHARRPELHRERLRHPRRARLLRPRLFVRLADQARRSELGEDLRRGRRALVPHRRHLRRARLQHRRSRDRGGGSRAQIRHDRLLRPQLSRLALEEPGRTGGGAARQPQDRQPGRRDDRQRGRFHRLPRLRGRGHGRAHLGDRPGQLQEDDRDRGEGIPELQGRGDDAAQRQDRDRSTTGRRSSTPAANSTSR